MIRRLLMATALILLTVAIVTAQFPVMNWRDKEAIKRYVTTIYANQEVPVSYILYVINRESSYRIVPSKSKSQVGLMQITPGCAASMGYNFDAVMKYPWINIECGVKYLTLCYRKAKGNLSETYRYYNRGLWWREVEAKKHSTRKSHDSTRRKTNHNISPLPPLQRTL